MNTLYLRKMGMDDNNLTGDIKNHRVRVCENIDIIYQGTAYNMFFEFMQWDRYTYRTTNKRTGKPLKKAIRELVNHNALLIDTQYEKQETDRNGFKWFSSWRLSTLEKEVHAKIPEYNKADILKVINAYSVQKYSNIVFVDEKATEIINRVGGFREKDILTKPRHYFRIGEWTADHKIIEVVDGENNNSVSVDIQTGRITG